MARRLLTFRLPTSRQGKRTIRAAAVLVSAVLALAACGGSGDSGAGSASGTVTIGMITATQGDLADLGKGFLDGANLAVDEINASGFLGDGKKLKLKTKEGSEDPQKEISALNQLTSDDKVSSVTCCITSPVGGALKPLAQAKKVPLVLVAATLPGLNEPPYVYRTYLPPNTYAPRLSQAAIEAYKPKSVAYAVTSDNDGMVTLLDAVRKPYDSAGVKDLGTVKVLAAQTDMHGTAATLVGKNPDVIQLQMAGNNTGTLVGNIKELGYKGKIVGTAQTSTKGTYTASGGALAGVPYPIDYIPASEAPLAQKFTKKFQDTYGRLPDGWAADGYTSIYFAATGAKNIIAKGDEVTRESLAKALNSISKFPTIYAEDTYMKDGQVTSDSGGVFGTWTSDGEQALWKPSS